MEKRSSRYESSQAGTILIAVIFLSILLAASASYLLARTRAELFEQNFRKYLSAATQYAASSMTIARVKINGGPWDWPLPDGQQNRQLLGKDPTPDGIPSLFYRDDTYLVYLNNEGDLWYTLTAVGIVDETFFRDTEPIIRVFKLRVRDRSSMASMALFLETGDGIVDDTNNWYGDIHTNEFFQFRNRIPGLGTQFYGNVTSCHEPRDYAESGGAAEAEYHGSQPVWNAEEIELPPTKTFSDLYTLVDEGENRREYDWGHDDDAVHVVITDDGIALTPMIHYGKVEMEFEREDHHGHFYQEVRIKVWDDEGGYESYRVKVPQNGVIWSQREIEGIQGDIFGRFTVACEQGYVKISDDIEYVDDDYFHPDHPYEYDDHHPEDPNNFTPNHKYDGNACLAVMAKYDILLTNQNGDDDLIMHGVYAAGIGGEKADGGVRWVDRDEGYLHPWTDKKRDLRLYGSIIADGVETTTGMTIGHFKGWTSGGAHAGGYNNSIFIYDYDLKTSPPPHFLEIQMPTYAAWQMERRISEDDKHWIGVFR